MVDDQPANLLSLEAILGDLGHTLVRAGSGEEALKCLLRDDFAVILLDVFMPGMDGFETAKLIRQRDRCRATPIIFLTALGTSEAQVVCGYSVGAVDYLLKPLIPEILKSKVAAFVELFLKTLQIAEQSEQLRQLERQCHEAELAEARRELEIERFERDLRAARQVQQALFPSLAPSCPGFDIAGAACPAEETGGDYFDYIPGCDGCLDIVIGDVCGHGLASALVMSSTRAYLRALAMTGASLGEALATANRALVADTEADRFVTLLYLRLSPSEHRLEYCSAGHPTAYIISREGEIRSLESTGLPMGIDPEEEFAVRANIRLHAGDTALLMTDGILESQSPDGEPFGPDRALRLVHRNRSLPAAAIVELLCREVQQFTDRSQPVDDLTAVVLKVA